MTAFVELLALAEHLVGDIQGSHHGDFLKAMDVATGLDLAHVLVEIAGGLKQSILFRGRAADLIFLVENLDHYGAGGIFFRAHAFSLVLQEGRLSGLLSGLARRTVSVPLTSVC